MDPKLYRAATSGDVGFLEQVANASNRTQLLLSTAPQQNTALHIAARFGHAHFTKRISQLCSSQLLRMKNSNHDTALHCAARAGCVEIVEILVDEVEGESSSSSSSVGLLRMQNKAGNTPLHEALINRQEDIAIRMVRADPKLAFVVNNANESSFLLSVKEEMEEFVKEMLSMDAISPSSSDDICIPITAHPQLTTEEMRELIKIQDSNGITALHYAAMRNNAKIICMILKIDSRHVPYMVDNNGHSPLHAAVAFGMQRSMLELLKHCPDTIEQFDTNGRNVLHIALLNRRFGIIRRLLELPYIGGLLNGPEPDKEENTPIYLTSKEDGRGEATAMRKENGQIAFEQDSVYRYHLCLHVHIKHH
ncbi:hypothetical protein ACLOJK_015450 [Asimina triloba]